MKIIHPSGQAYDLNIDTELELTRYNPFFHDKGEQSIPISLPATDHNLALLKHPESTAGRDKIAHRLDAQIQSGIFSVNARQAILSARKNDSIETSFYLREGAFYEKTKDISLQEIFEDKSIEFANIDAAINFMRSLIISNDNRFACFQVLTDTNRLNDLEDNPSGGTPRFINEAERLELIDDKEITIPKGFYITPFVKVRHILEEVLFHFGYTLGSSFLDDAPFVDMCFLNDNIDSIVGNRIDYVNLVPTISVSEFFEIIRKFNVEFIPDEQRKVLNLVLFNQVIDSTNVVSLDENIAGEVKINYPDYKELKLRSDHLTLPQEFDFPKNSISGLGRYTTLTGAQDVQESSLDTLLKKYPSAFIRRTDGAILRDGYKGNTKIREVIGHLSMSYSGAGENTVIEKTFPDTIPAIYSVPLYQYGDDLFTEDLALFNWRQGFTYPYVGTGRSMYSKIVMTGEDTNDFDEAEALETSSSNADLKPMLCFTYKDIYRNRDYGTLSNYNGYNEKMWDYSLMYNGADGIFEKFWRKNDNLLRNAFREVEADLLLTDEQKFSISALGKFVIDGQSLLLSEMKYAPGIDSIEGGSFLSTKMQLPLSTAKTEEEYIPVSNYKWSVVVTQLTWVWDSGKPPTSLTPYPVFPSDIATFFPLNPTEAQYNENGRYYEKIYDVEYYVYGMMGPVKVGNGTAKVSLKATLA